MNVMKMYRLLVASMIVICGRSDAFPRKKLARFPYENASVLINTCVMHKKASRSFILLGRKAGGIDQGMWDDFGGPRGKAEQNAMHTAAQKIFEELILQQTLGWTLSQVQRYLSLKKTHTSHVLAVHGIQKKNYVMYVTQLPFKLIKKICTRFLQARASMSSWAHRGKDKLALVLWNDLMLALQNDETSVPAYVYQEHTKTFSRAPKSITIRPLLGEKLKPFARGASFTSGADKRVRFYSL